MKKRFERATRPRNTDDDPGDVRIVVALIDPVRRGGYSKPGNILRTLTVRNAKVSEVHGMIERLLFNDHE